jgi:hypothetical protein
MTKSLDLWLDVVALLTAIFVYKRFVQYAHALSVRCISQWTCASIQIYLNIINYKHMSKLIGGYSCLVDAVKINKRSGLRFTTM